MRSIRRSLRAVFLTTLCSAAGVNAESAEIVITYIGATNTAAYLGVQQGLAEANVQGEFLGTQYRLIAVSSLPAEDDIGIAIISAVSEPALRELADKFRDVPMLNVALNAATLREQCSENLFHIGPSDTMLADANQQWQQKMPGSTARAQTWHKSFRKYAAGQLNSRFSKRFSRPMNDDAWAGWAAMKLLADTVVRRPSMTSRELLIELQTNLAFDGQKGSDLSFRETGQLRQPLLLVDEGKIVGEAPVRGVAVPPKLDSLGSLFCAK
jgi:hypothetical protein